MFLQVPAEGHAHPHSQAAAQTSSSRDLGVRGGAVQSSERHVIVGMAVDNSGAGGMGHVTPGAKQVSAPRFRCAAPVCLWPRARAAKGASTVRPTSPT
jgi:hypothetical protein